jgi:phosphoserine phosphatase
VITVPSGTEPAAAPVGPPLVVADLEGTCTSGETWRAVGRWLVENGRRGRYRRFLAPRLAALPLVRLGAISRRAFRDRWIRDLAGLLDGLTAADLEALARGIVEDELWPKRRVAVVKALEAAAADGARVVIASGTYEPVLAAFVARLAGGPAGPVVGLGTPLQMADGRTTGRLVGRVGTGSLKADRVSELAAGAPVHAAYGDSLADAPLLELADEAIAVAPDRELRVLAIGRGWRILDDSPGKPR